VAQVDQSLEPRHVEVRRSISEHVFVVVVVAVGQHGVEEMLLVVHLHLAVEVEALPARPEIFLQVVVEHQPVAHPVEILVYPLGHVGVLFGRLEVLVGVTRTHSSASS
jgi:hypothetical protein